MIISNIYIYIYIYSCVNVCIYKYVIWPPQTKISGYAPAWDDFVTSALIYTMAIATPLNIFSICL